MYGGISCLCGMKARRACGRFAPAIARLGLLAKRCAAQFGTKAIIKRRSWHSWRAVAGCEEKKRARVNTPSRHMVFKARVEAASGNASRSWQNPKLIKRSRLQVEKRLRLQVEIIFGFPCSWCWWR